jgi:hypothetical protein
MAKSPGIQLTSLPLTIANYVMGEERQHTLFANADRGGFLPGVGLREVFAALCCGTRVRCRSCLGSGV